MRIFVNNVDGHVAGAICADLRKLTPNIIGTRKGANLELVPQAVKKVVPRIEVRRLLKTVATCDVVVYDLHDADLEELELMLRVLSQSELSQEMTFILISSVGVWARTQREYEVAEESGSIPDRWTSEVDVTAGGEGQTSAEASADDAADAADGEQGECAESGNAASKDLAAAMANRPPRPKPLHSEDYVRRIPMPKFQEWRTIETLALALKEKPLIRPYVVCAGLPYGNGEDAFLGLFKAAWQTRPTLRVIGEGHNSIPLVHVRDAARLVRRVIEERPGLDYHLAVDRGDCTQRELIEAVAGEFGIPYAIRSISVAEAILAEMADLLTMDLRLEPSQLMVEPRVEPPADAAAAPTDEAADPSAAPSRPSSAPAAANAAAPNGGAPAASLAGSPMGAGADSGEGSAGLVDEAGGAGGEAEKEKPPAFRWWCEKGLVTNVSTVSHEFRRWRRLDPVRFCVMGPPGSCSSEIGSLLAERYNLPHAVFEDLVEEQRILETPTGQLLRDKFAEIEAALANPKSTGPYLLPASLAAKVVEEAVLNKPCEYRGFVISGFPRSLEEASEFFLEDAPLSADAEAAAAEAQADPKKAGKGKVDAAPVVEKVLRAGRRPDVVALVSAPEESCLARLQAGDKPEDQWMPTFKKKFERWQKEFPPTESGPSPVVEFLTSKCGIEPIVLKEPAPIPASDAEGGEERAAAGGAGEEAGAGEGEAGGAPTKVLSPGEFIRAAAAEVCALAEASRPINNFLAPPPPPSPEVDQEPNEAVAAEEDEQEVLRREEEERKKREAAERLELLRKDELARLEKHSEPLRQYLSSFVVPTVTHGLIEVCRAQPDDPVGFLAEYLTVYSQLSRRKSFASVRNSVASVITSAAPSRAPNVGDA